MYPKFMVLRLTYTLSYHTKASFIQLRINFYFILICNVMEHRCSTPLAPYQDTCLISMTNKNTRAI